MKRLFYLSVILSIIFYSSCTRYLMPSNLGNDMIYQPKPMVADSINSKTTVIGGIMGSGGFYDEGAITLGYLGVNRGHTFKNINFSYGLLGYLGNVEKAYISETTNDSKYVSLPQFNKATYGYGIRTSIGYHDTSERGNTDFRIINWENAITIETGEYLNFRKQLYGDLTYKRLIVSKNEVLWTTGISSEIIFHNRKNKNFKHAFKIFIGGSPNLYRSFDNKIKFENPNIDDSEIKRGYFQFTYFFSYKKFSLVTQADLSNLSSNFGLGYSF